MTSRNVFVYGTLRRGEQRDITKLNPAPQFVGRASVQGRLFNLGSYPGLVLGGQELVSGEVYVINPELERLLDEIEEVWPAQNGEYKKREALVRLDTKTSCGGCPAGVELRCLVYEATPRAIKGRVEISGGDWVVFRLGRAPPV